MTAKTDPSAATDASAIELALKHPFHNAAGVRIERIALRRARRADLRAAAQFSKDEFAQETFLFARLSGLTMEDIDSLDLEDNVQLAQRFRGLLGNAGAPPADAATDR